MQLPTKQLLKWKRTNKTLCLDLRIFGIITFIQNFNQMWKNRSYHNVYNVRLFSFGLELIMLSLTEILCLNWAWQNSIIRFHIQVITPWQGNDSQWQLSLNRPWVCFLGKYCLQAAISYIYLATNMCQETLRLYRFSI